MYFITNTFSSVIIVFCDLIFIPWEHQLYYCWTYTYLSNQCSLPWWGVSNLHVVILWFNAIKMTAMILLKYCWYIYIHCIYTIVDSVGGNWFLRAILHWRETRKCEIRWEVHFKLNTSKKERKCKQWWLTIPPISTKRTCSI